MVKGKKYDGFNIDIWAIGVILFAMLCGYLPFEDDENDNDVLFNQIIKNKIDYPPFLSELSLDILKKILVSDPLKRITIEEIKKHEFYLKGERIYNEKFSEKKNNNEIKNNILLEKLKKINKSENDYEKKVLQTTVNERTNNNHKNILFLDYLKSDKANKKNNIQHKAPVTITLNKGDNSNQNSNNLSKINTINNTHNNTVNNSKIIIHKNDNYINSMIQKKLDYNKYCKTNNNLDYNKKTNYLVNENNKGKEGLMNLFGLKQKKKLFTKLQIKNYKDKIFGMRNFNNDINDDNSNKLNIRDKPYKLNLDIIKNTTNSFEKHNHRLNDELTNNYENKMNMRNNNIYNLKIINTKYKNRRKDNSLKNKLLKYNIYEMKQYNRLLNQINININNVSRSVQRTQLEKYTKQNFTNNNIINLNVILNDTLNNNNKNLESLRITNNTIKNIKKNLPATPSQIRFIPSKKSTLPSITITERIKPKITTHKFKSVNNSKYMNTESNYNKVDRQKKVFLDNVNKKHDFLKYNYPKNNKLNKNIYF